MEEKDGMAAVNQGVADQKFPHCIDAMVWADEYCQTFSGTDKMTMVGWFANAIMAGYDTAGMRCSGEIQQLQADNGQRNDECNKLKLELAQATQREARLREALTEIVEKCEDEDWEYMFGDIIARAKQALEEADT